MKAMLKISQGLLERNLIPDAVIRIGIRGLLSEKLKQENALKSQLGSKPKTDLIEFLRSSPIAVNTREANEQHYELPTNSSSWGWDGT